MRFIALLLTALLLTGCYSGATVQQMIKDAKDYQVPIKAQTDKGLVYVVRPSSLYGIFKYNVYLDGREDNAWVGYNRGYQYIFFNVEPGVHTVASHAENWNEVSFEIQAGQTVYIIQDASWGFLFGRNDVKKLNPVEAKYHIKHANLGTILQPSPASTPTQVTTDSTP